MKYPIIICCGPIVGKKYGHGWTTFAYLNVCFRKPLRQVCRDWAHEISNIGFDWTPNIVNWRMLHFLNKIFNYFSLIVIKRKQFSKNNKRLSFKIWFLQTSFLVNAYSGQHSHCGIFYRLIKLYRICAYYSDKKFPSKKLPSVMFFFYRHYRKNVF